MPKLARELQAIEVARLTGDRLHMVGGVQGLGLQINGASRAWVLRAVVGGKRRDMGLGAFPGVTLAMARKKAAEAREAIRQGIDPVAQAKGARSALRAAEAAALTFEQCAERYIKTHRAGWRSPKHAAQWESTLALHAYPVLGDLLVRDVALTHVLQVLEPIWGATTETAVRLRGRIELILDWAAARGLRDAANPARWRGHLDKLLAKPSKVARREHFAALPVSDVGAFMARLREAEGTGARALEFAILTAARSGEVRGATWAEIDMQAGVWTIPGSRMKAGKEHRVPLSDAALAVLAALPEGEPDDIVFKAQKGGKLSDMTVSAVLRRMAVPAVPHGFRSTFRDWAGERTNHPREVAEAALAHAIGDKVEAAYRRGDAFDKRRVMMQAWADFLARVEQPAQVVELRRAAGSAA